MKFAKYFAKYIAVVALPLVLSVVNAFGQSTDEARVLPPAQTVEREMTGAETHRYKFDLAANEFFQARVEQKGVDVALKLTDAGGAALAAMDSPNGAEGSETLSFVAQTAGAYVLEVSGFDAKAEKGAYIISRSAARVADDRDQRRVAAERSFVEGMTARDTQGQSETAVAKLEAALQGWRELKDEYLIQLTAQQINQLKLSRYTAEIFGESNSEIRKGQELISSGQMLVGKSRADALPAREKFAAALAQFRAVNGKLKDRSVVEKINQTGALAAPLNDSLTYNRYFSKSGEGLALDGISQTHFNLNEWQEAINYKKQAAAVYGEMVADQAFAKIDAAQHLSLKSLEATTYADLGGQIDALLDDKEESLKYLSLAVEKHRALYEETKDSKHQFHIAQTFMRVAGVYGREAKEYEKSVEFYNRAIEIYRRDPGREFWLALGYDALATRHSANFNYRGALENWEKALEIYKRIDHKPGQASLLQSIAGMYYLVGNAAKLKETANQILKIVMSPDFVENAKKRMSSTSQFEAFNAIYGENVEYVRLLDIATAHIFLEDYAKALEYYSKAVESARARKNPRDVGTNLWWMGYIFEKQEKLDKAVEYYKQSLEINRMNGSRQRIAGSLGDVGIAFFKSGNFPEALKYLNDSLTVFDSAGVNENKSFDPGFSVSLIYLSQTHYALKNQRLAILYGKRAVNAMQSERQRLQTLDSLSQKGFLEKKEKHYRRLAEWLIADGRLVEAEQVLAMLKQEEVTDYLRGSSAAAEKFDLRIDFTPTEKKAVEDYRKNAEPLAAIGAEFSKLEDLKRGGAKLSAEQEKQYAELNNQLTAANRTFQDFLNKLTEEFKSGKNPEQDLRENFNLQSNLDAYGEGVVFAYTLIGEDKFNSILVTPDAETAETKAITAAELNKKIFAFREAVKNPSVDPRPLGKELYDVLIQPLEKNLEAAKTKTILWHLDGNLRLLPLAALWDGKQYFGQKYRNVVITGKSLQNIGLNSAANPNVLGLGVSESKIVPETPTERRFAFEALPSVPQELGSIVQTTESPNGVLPGASLLNAGFTRKSFAEQLLKKYKIVHIASHFSMNAGDASRSFLLLGDGNVLTVSDLNIDPAFKNKFAGVDLLTLSACETAVGETGSNGREVEGFAYVAQQNGARAILATLWSVADDSTALLMSEFYKFRKDDPNTSKAEAMQKAQTKLIQGAYQTLPEAQTNRSEAVSLSGGKTKQPPYKKDEKAPFAHPYYWSPFVLIGNWR